MHGQYTNIIVTRQQDCFKSIYHEFAIGDDVATNVTSCHTEENLPAKSEGDPFSIMSFDREVNLKDEASFAYIDKCRH